MPKKISVDAAEAFFLKTGFSRSNTCVRTEGGRGAWLYLFGNCIAKIENGETYIKNCGYTTYTTHDRLNALVDNNEVVFSMESQTILEIRQFKERINGYRYYYSKYAVLDNEWLNLTEFRKDIEYEDSELLLLLQQFDDCASKARIFEGLTDRQKQLVGPLLHSQHPRSKKFYYKK